MDQTGGISFDDLKRLAKSVPVDQVVARYVALKRQGAEYKACCPFHDESTPSFTVVPRKEMYHCFGCGAHGDGVGFVMAMDKVDFITAAKAICSGFGLACGSLPAMRAPVQPVDHAKLKQEEHAVNQRRADRISEMWAASVPAQGTIVVNYLRSRGIPVEQLNPDLFYQLRFVETDYFEERVEGGFRSRGVYPVMLSPMQDSAGRVRALHLTYLAKDGSGKLKLKHSETGQGLPSKKMIGKSWGCAIRLGPKADRMAIAEGIETGLSYLVSNTRTCNSLWVAGSIGNMSGRGVGEGEPHPNDPARKLPSRVPDHAHPGIELPSMCQEVVLIKDNDGKDQLAIDCQVERAARRFYQKLIKVRIVEPPVGFDLNDVLMGGSP